MTRLVIDKKLAMAVASHCTRWAPKETGGIVVGYRCEHAVHVTGLVGPGPRAKHARASFVRDGDFAQRSLQEVVRQTGGASDYLGEWHSHPVPVEPSGRDERSLHWVATNAAYACEDPILIVVTRAGRRWTPRAFTFDDARLVACEVADTCANCGRPDRVESTVRPDDT